MKQKRSADSVDNVHYRRQTSFLMRSHLYINHNFFKMLTFVLGGEIIPYEPKLGFKLQIPHPHRRHWRSRRTGSARQSDCGQWCRFDRPRRTPPPPPGHLPAGKTHILTVTLKINRSNALCVFIGWTMSDRMVVFLSFYVRVSSWFFCLFSSKNTDIHRFYPLR